MIEIPLTSAPEQLFSANIDGTTYDFRVVWNSRSEFWTISVRNQNVSILEGVPLVSGIDIFKQYNIPIRNVFMVNMDNPNVDPSFDNLGTVCRLFVLTDEEIASVEAI